MIQILNKPLWTGFLALTAPVVLVLTFQNCSSFVVARSSTSGSSYCTTNTADKACLADLKPSCTFNGAPLAEGAKVTAYLASTADNGSTCQAQTRTCTAGTLGGTYAFATCSVGGVPACLFSGMTIPSGTSVTAYLNSSMASCTPQTRNCLAGNLSGSYGYASCVTGGPQSCLFNGQTVAHGQSVTGFATSQVPSGQSCGPNTRTCWNGALSGSGDYASCTVAAPASCLFNGVTIASGASVNGYASPSVAAGQSCQPETRACQNGELSGSAAYASCVVNAPTSCLINGQTIPDGGSVSLYQNPSVGQNANCAAEIRTCRNGNLSGSATFASCVPTSVLCGASAVNNPSIDATSSLQACMNTSTPLVELVAGRYYLDSPLVFSNRTNVTLRTQSIGGGPACLDSGAANCAILTATENFSGPTLLESYDGASVTFEYFALDGNNALRKQLHPTNDWPNGIAYNSRIHRCAHCNFSGFTSIRAPQGTGLEFSGDYAVFDRCMFRDNGWGLLNYPQDAGWSDGLTVHSSVGIHITNSIFRDNSDINLILGNAPNALIESNWIGNTYNFAYGALMLDNFGGAMPGDYTGAIIRANTIDCGQGYCGLGINIGPHLWYDAPQVIGGSVTGNNVVGARQGILTDGATGWDISGNSVGVLGIYTNGTFSTNFISYTDGDSVSIHDNNQAAQPSGLVGFSVGLFPTMLSNFNGTGPVVSKAFRDVLGRDPDVSGGPAFTTAMRNGMSVAQLRQQLASSAEGVAAINNVFVHTLKRGVDAGGLTTWQNYLVGGGSIPQMWVLLEQSPEGIAATYNL